LHFPFRPRTWQRTRGRKRENEEREKWKKERKGGRGGRGGREISETDLRWSKTGRARWKRTLDIYGSLSINEKNLNGPYT